MQTQTHNIHPADFARTAKAWNEANKAARQRMLEAAGRNKNAHYSRAFNFIPRDVRDDVIYAYQRSLAPQSQTKQQSTPTQKAA